MAYEVFVVEIRQGWDGGLMVNVIRSPAGQGQAPFNPPFDAAELHLLGVDLRRARGRDIRPAAGTMRPLSPIDTGDRLFRAVFHGAVRHRFERSLGLVAATGANLCIHFEIDLRQPELAWLHELPWELLYDAETEEFLCLSGRVQVARYIDTPRPEGGKPPLPPLTILAVASEVCGGGYAELDLDQELSNLQQATRQEDVELVIFKEPSREALAAVLAERCFRVLHFLGHGWFDEGSGEGGLVFHRAGQAPDRVSGKAIATELKARHGLEVVVLNSCSSARTGGSSGGSPFLGAATALVLAGIPCVVAMRLPISDAGAIAFSRAFYRSLAAGEAIEASVYAGRLAVERLEQEGPEWSIPVLFLRCQSGGLVARRRWVRVHRRTLNLLLALLGLAISLAAMSEALQRPLWKIPGLRALCAAWRICGAPTREEQALWAGRATGSCDGLQAYLDRFPNGAFAEEAERRLHASRTVTIADWRPQEHRFPLTVRPTFESLPSEAAARADALKRGAAEAASLCLEFNTGEYRLLAAEAEPGAEGWRCSARGVGTVCGFDGRVLCRVEARHARERRVCD